MPVVSISGLPSQDGWAYMLAPGKMGILPVVSISGRPSQDGWAYMLAPRKMGILPVVFWRALLPTELPGCTKGTYMRL